MFVCTVGAEQGLKLSQEADGVELSEESVVTETVPQFDNEATDESGELQHTNKHTHTHAHEHEVELLVILRRCLFIAMTQQ